MKPNLWTLYSLMLKSRLFEEAVTQLWKDGFISGEMHLGTGEEAINAGIISQLQSGDAMALDHRGTPPLLMRGIDPVLILRELLGLSTGLCGGMGGHMHLFSKESLSASSGIVGAEGPAAVGFALAARYLRPGSIAVAFFGEGAMNQGMLLEAMNLASVWKLPVLFVCKDDRWSITSKSNQLTGGSINDRAHGFGLPVVEVDGLEVVQVWEAARSAIERVRSDQGPSFMHAKCVHLEGHFLGYQLLRSIRDPVKEMPVISKPLMISSFRPCGSRLGERIKGVSIVLSTIIATLRDPRQDFSNDPLVRSRAVLQSNPERLKEIEDSLQQDIASILSNVLPEEIL